VTHDRLVGLVAHGWLKVIFWGSCVIFWASPRLVFSLACSLTKTQSYPQNIVLPIPIIAINCQSKLIAGLEKRQLIVVSPTII
jgi:hypothetical protein